MSPGAEAEWQDEAGAMPDTGDPGRDAVATEIALLPGDLTSVAYERIEELFVSMHLAPGATIRTQDLQSLTGLGRTPVHQAVRRLAAETLLEIQPRNGLRISPIDLERERRLATLRRDLDRFLIGAAIAGMQANERARLRHMTRHLEEEGRTITLDRFNVLDKAFDMLLIRASRERFLERSLRPLRALGRRSGYLDITRISGAEGLADSIAHHLAIMQAVLDADEPRARDLSDRLVDYSVTILDRLERRIDPSLLDIGFGLGKDQAWPAPPPEGGAGGS